jgi:hypothetical protein
LLALARSLETSTELEIEKWWRAAATNRDYVVKRCIYVEEQKKAEKLKKEAKEKLKEMK